MDTEPTITLHCVRKNGSREQTKLSLRSVSEAREVAKRVLRLGNGLYTEVDICTEDGTLETIMNSGANENAPEVLLVEDNAGDALLVGQALADCPTKVNLHIARDGEQALLMLTDPYFKPNLILLDLNIPRITGLALLERWQSIDIPIVVFSSSLNEAEQKRVVELGAKEFISKPTDIQAFIDAVCAIVQRWALPQASSTASGSCAGS